MWQPSDYVIDGKYCDTASIKQQLRLIQSQFGADSALLLVCQKMTLFKSLLLITHVQSAKEIAYQQLLFNGSLTLRKGESFDPPEELLKALLLRKPLEQISGLFTEAANVRILSNMRVAPRNIEWDTQLAGAAHESNPSIAIFLINANIEPDSGAVTNADDLNDILSMINASAPVKVHKDLYNIMYADTVIDAHERQIPEQTFELKEPAEALLTAALKLTGSSVGNVYLTTSDKRRLRLAAAVNNANPISEFDTDATTSIVTWVYLNERPLLINNIEEFEDTHPDITYLWVGGQSTSAYAELTIPIRQRNFGSRQYSVLGVINVEKVRDSDTGFYTYRDLAILRDIALRLCIWRSNSLFSLSARSLARLTRRNISSISSAGEWQEPQGLKSSGFSEIPREALIARQDISSIVQHVYELTRSLSVTVRLLSTNTSRLVRFCAFPETVMADEFPVIARKSGSSVNAWVARTGQECYIADTNNVAAETQRFQGLHNYLRVRADVLSELCLPVFVSGRLVGTLNLESAFKDAYSETLHLARAIAEQVGLSLAHSRQVIEEVIWSRTANITVNTHELLKCVSDLGDLAKQVDEPASSALVSISKRISTCVEGDSSGGHSGADTTANIIQGVIEELNFTEHIKWGRTPSREHIHSPLTSLAMKLAFAMILDNAYNHALQTNEFMVTLFANECTIGGLPYLSIAVMNRVLNKVPENIEQSLYRVPIQRDRLHIGAFAAGAAMRAIGGDVYVGINDGRRLRTVIDIPLEKPRTQ